MVDDFHSAANPLYQRTTWCPPTFSAVAALTAFRLYSAFKGSATCRTDNSIV